MGFGRAALWFVVVVLAYGLAKLLFDNILYAAIMRRLETAFGIKEGDVIAVVATNLIPLLGFIVVVAVIYWLSLQQHKTAALATDSALAPTPSTSKKQPWTIKGFFARRDPLPVVAIALAAAFTVALAWQFKFGPLIGLRPSTTPPPRITEIDRLAGLNVLTQLATNMQSAATYSKGMREIADNWQYKISTDGPDAFNAALDQASAGYIYGSNGMYYVRNQYKGLPSDVLVLATDDGTLAACNARAAALAAEIKRIKEHKADLVFTLVNDIKLIEWRNGIQTCDDWIANKRVAIEKKCAEYSQKGN